MRPTPWVLTGLALTTGCHGGSPLHRLSARIHSLPGLPKNQLPPPAPVTFSGYQLPGWNWSAVHRVLVLPPLNESPYTRADEEFQAALSSELQRLGRFEVVNGPPDDCARLAATIHRDGRFDEALMLELAESTKADVIVHAIITQYSPYPRPRLGVVIQAVAPKLGKVVASVDGLWDTTDAGIAEQLRTYYRQRPQPLPPRVRNHQIVSDDAFAGELALDSPALFQRWVAHLAAERLTADPIETTTIVPVGGTVSGSTGGSPTVWTCPPKPLFGGR